MEPSQNGAQVEDARTPELPPPHLLLDLASQPTPKSDDSQKQNGADVSLKTDLDVHSSVFDKPDATCDDVSDISSTPSAIPQSAQNARSQSPHGSSKGTTDAQARGQSPASSDGEKVERRRKRIPSAPRSSSGIPRLSATEGGRRVARTASESRQRPKSDIHVERNNGDPLSRSSNFGWNSRRPHSALHERSKTDPAQGDLRRTPRSSTSSTSSLQSSGGRRMEIRSKIGSLDNAKHKPGGGNVKIFNEKKDVSNVGSKCGSLDYAGHKAGGGNVQITDEKVKFREAAVSKVGSFNNAKHKPGGGDIKIDNQKLKWEVKSKVGSLDNATHKAGGGDKKIQQVKVDFRERASSKVGSLNNAKHVPGGGDKKIYNEKVNWEVTSKVGSLKNADHKAGGGDVKIFSEVLPWTEPPKPVQSYPQYRQIHSQPLYYKNEAQPKVGSFDNVNHNPGGGEVEN